MRDMGYYSIRVTCAVFVYELYVLFVDVGPMDFNSMRDMDFNSLGGDWMFILYEQCEFVFCA